MTKRLTYNKRSSLDFIGLLIKFIFLLIQLVLKVFGIKKLLD